MNTYIITITESEVIITHDNISIGVDNLTKAYEIISKWEEEENEALQK